LTPLLFIGESVGLKNLSMTKFNNYKKAVEFLNSLINLPIKNFMLKTGDRQIFVERLTWFLRELKNPEKGFKYIHITGTAGKGSTVNYLHQILTKAGKKVGSYYSPYPTTAIENIKVGNLYISPADFAKLADKLKPIITKAILSSPYGAPSYFEIFLSLAFLYFKQEKCEYVILETGLGGTHDATCVIKNPIIAAITCVDYDHQDLLGKTLTKIATDKSGIIKKGCKFFTTEKRSHILKIFQDKCLKLKVPFHQIKASAESPNLTLVKAIAQELKIPEKIVNKTKFQNLPCRFEIMQKKPLVILDGSHNPAKIKFLSQNLKNLKNGRINAIIGMAENKDLAGSLKAILPQLSQLILTRFDNSFRKSADLKKLRNLSLNIKPDLNIKVFLDPWEALDYGLKITHPQDTLLIAGSFYLAGRLRTRWITEETILKKRRSF